MELSVKKKKIIAVALLVALGLVSAFWLGEIFTSESTFTGTYKNLDDKRMTVTELMGGAAAASTAISLIPGDGGTPIAEQLADLSGYFMFIMAAVTLEKWLLTITGTLAFRIMIPVGLGLILARVISGKQILTSYGLKVILVAIAIFAIIPLSVFVSEKIDESYEASVKQTIEETNRDSKAIRDAVGNEKNENVVERIFDKVKGGVSGQVRKFEGTLSRMSEAIAVLIVTCCAIPIAVFLFFIWIIKLVTGINIQIPSVKASKFIGKRG